MLSNVYARQWCKCFHFHVSQMDTLCLAGPQNWTEDQPRPYTSTRFGPSLNRTGDLSLWRSRLLCLHCFEHHDGWRRILLRRRAGEGHVLQAVPECFKQISLDLCRHSLPSQLFRQWFILHPLQFAPQSSESKHCSMGTQKIFSILTQADQSYCQHSSKHSINFDTFFMVVVNVLYWFSVARSHTGDCQGIFYSYKWPNKWGLLLIDY